MSVTVNVEITEGKELAKQFGKSSNVKSPIDKGIKRITLKFEGLAKKATVVDTGRLRSSISHRYFGTNSAAVGTNVQYAQFVEYGTKNMDARHMEGASKVVDGVGMLTYAYQQTKEWLAKEGGEITKQISDKICNRSSK